MSSYKIQLDAFDDPFPVVSPCLVLGQQFKSQTFGKVKSQILTTERLRLENKQ